MLFDDKHQRVDLRGDSPIAKDYQEKMKELDKYKFPLRLKTRFNKRINPTGEREPYQSTIALFTGYINYPDGTTEKVRYSRTNPKIKNGKYEYDEGSGEVVTDSMLITDKEKDKAYFMLYLCPVVKRKMLVLENKKEEAEKTLRAGASMAAVWYYLTDPDSIIFNDEKTIRTIATSFGVSNADSERISLQEVKLSLIRHIERGEASGDANVNVEAFKKATSLPEFTKKRADVYRAIDNEILRFDESKMRYEVKFGGAYTKLIDVTSRDMSSPEDALIRIMDSNAEIKDLFYRAVGNPDAGLKADDVRNMTTTELKSRCKQADIPTFGKKNEVLQSELIEKLGL
jgi:hypothetical protein